MANWIKTTAIALAASGAVMAAPASATVFEYTMKSGDTLIIDTENGTGSWKGNKIDATFTGDFSGFQGGANPSFMFTLSSLEGTRIVKGKTVEATNKLGNNVYKQKLKTGNGNTVNLWTWWGDPVVSGDYVRKIAGFKIIPHEVPAPGVLGLFSLALIALGFGRRRRTRFAKA